jgi:sulfoxide reductase heme-binding subunit YedZ
VNSPVHLKSLFCLLCLAPALHLLLLAFTSGLGANPIEKILHTTGDWSLNFLCLTLAISPLCRFTGWSWPAPLRIWSGLFGFLYAGLHFLTYAVLDQGLSWPAIGEDILKRRHIAVGLASLLLLGLPAAASIRQVKRLLGSAGRRCMQYPVYAAAVGGVVHYLWLGKIITRRPLVYAAVVCLLLGYRVVASLLRQRRRRRIV